jgi:hypothetical protein
MAILRWLTSTANLPAENDGRIYNVNGDIYHWNGAAWEQTNRAGSEGGGDAWSDAVDADIVPDGDGTRDLGTTGTRFAETYTDALTVTNNIVVGGTVDGRDVGADGAKLDGIEAGADVTDATNVASAGAFMAASVSAFGASLVDDVDASAARTTLGVDAAGTDNSTNVTLAGSLDYLTITGQQITRNAIDLTADVTGQLPFASVSGAGGAAALNVGTTAGTVAAGDHTHAQLHDVVTLAGTPDYITISGQVITRGSVDLAADVTGNLPVTNLAGGSGATASTFWRGDGAWAAAAGGSDPWTNVILASNFSTTAATAQNVTSFNFTPAADTTYLIQGYFLLRTITATIGARPGFAWPTGITDGGGWMQVPNSATASAQRWWGTLDTQAALSTGLPNTTASHLAVGEALMIVGDTPSGNFQITLQTETATNEVIMRAGSFFRYRIIA